MTVEIPADPASATPSSDPAAGAPPAPVDVSGTPSGTPDPVTPPAGTDPAPAPAGERPATASDPAKPTDPAASADPAADPNKPAEEADKDDKPGIWPDDWREKLAGDDKAFLKRLQRFDSPAALAQSYRNAEAKIAQGGAKTPLPENPTEEQLATYRAENGIPETPDGYDIKPEGGFVFAEEDKPILESLKGYAHGKNIPADVLNTFTNWYAGYAEELGAARDAQDRTFKAEAEDTLRAEWGREYRGNVATVENFLAANAPDGLAGRLFGGRSADGKRFGDDPDLMRFIVRMARDANPTASVVPAGTSNPGKAVDDEIKSIEQTLATSPETYWSDKGMRDRFAELLTAREAAASRR